MKYLIQRHQNNFLNTEGSSPGQICYHHDTNINNQIVLNNFMM
jgi:hypothetical protein